jgi:hypothetical protein
VSPDPFVGRKFGVMPRKRGLWYGHLRVLTGGEHEYAAAEGRFAGGIGSGGNHARLGAIGTIGYI